MLHKLKKLWQNINIPLELRPHTLLLTVREKGACFL
ncbi:tRNA lysidine(34) synthetase TilS [Flavobacterium beibuense]